MKLILISKKEIAKGVWEFSFGIAGKNFRFIPGQYVRVVVPRLIKKDSRGQGRVFSIASSPNNKKKITIVFRVSKSGYKQTLLRTKVSESLEIEGPWGRMTLPKKPAPLVLIAGGTGIAPFLSMISFAAEQKLKHQIHLVYASRGIRDAFYLKDLKKLEKVNPGFKMSVIYRSIDKNSFPGNIFEQKRASFCISGPSAMIDAAVALLEEKGVKESRIYFEEWSKYVFQQTIPRQVVDRTLDGIVITDLNGFIRYVNSVWQRFSGWKSKEVIAKVTPRIVKSGFQDQAFYKKIWDTALAGKTYKFEAVNKNKNGQLYTAEEISVPLRSRSGCIFGHFGIQRDVTRQKKNDHDLKDLTRNLEQKVEEQTESLKAMLLSIGDGLAVVDKNMKTIMINRAAQNIIGLPEKEVLGKAWPELVRVHTDKAKKMPISQSPLARALEGQKIFTTITDPINYFYIKKDKTRIPVSITATPLIVGKEISGAIVVFRDLTEAKKAREELKESEEKFRAVVETAADAIISSDDRGKTIFWNKGAERMFGYKEKDILGKPLTIIMPQRYQAAHLGGMKHLRVNGEARIMGKTYEVDGLRKSGEEFPVSLSLSGWDVGGKRFYTAIIRDITERKKIDKMKSEFVSIASHQLRTPLTAIRWIIERLTTLNGKLGPLSQKQKDYLNKIYNSNMRMIELVDNLLNISRLEEGTLKIELQPRQFEDIIEEVIKNNEDLTLKKQCEVFFERPKEKLPLIPLDKSLTEQIISNLLTNAIRYSRQQSRVKIKLEKRADDYLLQVSDMGIGIAKDAQDRIFTKFFRTDSAQKMHTEGSGLGLYITKMIVELSGGKIWFESEENRGTTFYVSLPIKGMKERVGEKELAG